QDGAHRQGREEADAREGGNRHGEEPAVALEVRQLGGDGVVEVAEDQVQVVLDLVGDLMCGGDVDLGGAGEVAGVIGGLHLLAGGGVSNIGVGDAVQDQIGFGGGVQFADGDHVLGEIGLRRGDLVVPRVHL